MILSLLDGTVIVSSWNPDFERIIDTNSDHSEMYAILVSLTFLEFYYDHFSLSLFFIKPPIEAFCDKALYVTKLNELTSNKYFKLFIHNIKKCEAILVLLDVIPK